MRVTITGSGDPFASKLFWEFVRLLKELKPTYFLLENVSRIEKKWVDVINKALGVEAVELNGADFSAQQRKRLFWNNFNINEISSRSADVIADVLGLAPTERHNKIMMTKADFKVKIVDNSLSGLHLEINGNEFFGRLIGEFNAYNLLSAYL